MTGIRTLVRRGLAVEPLYASIPDEFELVWLALRTVRDDWNSFLTEKHSRGLLAPRDWRWGILTGFFEPGFSDGTIMVDLLLPNFLNPELPSALPNHTNYVRQLSKVSNQEFVLGFKRSSHHTLNQCKEARAAADLISAAPNIPLRSYDALASKLTTAMEGVMEIMGPDFNVEWKHDWIKPQYGCDWQIDVLGGLCAKTSWIP